MNLNPPPTAGVVRSLLMAFAAYVSQDTSSTIFRAVKGRMIRTGSGFSQFDEDMKGQDLPMSCLSPLVMLASSVAVLGPLLSPSASIIPISSAVLKEEDWCGSMIILQMKSMGESKVAACSCTIPSNLLRNISSPATSLERALRDFSSSSIFALVWIEEDMIIGYFVLIQNELDRRC